MCVVFFQVILNHPRISSSAMKYLSDFKETLIRTLKSNGNIKTKNSQKHDICREIPVECPNTRESHSKCHITVYGTNDVPFQSI